LNLTGNVVGNVANVTLQAGTYSWTFDNTGNLTVANVANSYINGVYPSGNIIMNPPGPGQFIVTNTTPSQFGNAVGVAGNLTVGNITLVQKHTIASGVQSAPTSGAITANAGVVLGGAGGNYLTMGQYPSGSTINSIPVGYSQWMQSGYGGNATYYSIVLNPLGGNIVAGGNVLVANAGGVYGQAPAYSTGTWTPSLTASTTAPTVTYSSQSGYWTKVGNMVFVNGYLNINNPISAQGSGTLQVTGLPFTVLDEMVLLNFSATDALTNYYSTGSPGITQIYGHGVGGNTINFRGAGPGKGTTDLQCGSLLSGYILFSCYYRTQA
jgi:hypothetical protein